PGWHIECSAMAEKYLGPEFWIHGGGLDLVFPHHENERAQSVAAGRPFARVWMHNGMVRFVGEKMSKSVGNVATIREVLDEWGREAALLFFLTAHWRKPIDFSDETMAAAKAQATTFRNFLLEGDFNTPDALALFHEWRSRGDAASLRWGLDLFGLGSLAAGAGEPPAEVVSLAERRARARGEQNWAEADRLRDEIEAAGWEVRDVADAPGFRLVPRG